MITETQGRPMKNYKLLLLSILFMALGCVRNDKWEPDFLPESDDYNREVIAEYVIEFQWEEFAKEYQAVDISAVGPASFDPVEFRRFEDRFFLEIPNAVHNVKRWDWPGQYRYKGTNGITFKIPQPEIDGQPYFVVFHRLGDFK